MFYITARFRIAIALALAFLLLPLAQVYATDITVNSTCSLANAITAANTDTPTGGCSAGSGADTIILSGNVTLTSALPSLTSAITITGNNRKVSRSAAANTSSFRIFSVDSSSANVIINKLTISNGKYAGQGGGISVTKAATLTLNDSAVSGNVAESDSGGIHVWGVNTITHSVLNINNSVITGNHANHGGSMYIWYGKVNIKNSAITGNIAQEGGGGIYMGNGTLNIENSTISGNKADHSSFGEGGGLFIYGGVATLKHVTIAMNEAKTVGSGIYKAADSTLNLYNSIIADSETGQDCWLEDPLDTIEGNAGNLIEDDSCSNVTVAVRGDPMLAPLRSSPVIHPLYAGSPAIDAADEDHCLPKDQRGTTRGAKCDIGAYEGSIAKPEPEEEEDEPDSAPVLICPSRPEEQSRFGEIGSEEWRGHFARLGIQAANASKQTEWARGDAGVSGANICLWEYECSTDGHWAYGHYHATRGHNYGAPGTRPPAAVNRSPGGAFNLCYSVWSGGCNSAEAWQFGHASGKEIYERWLYGHQLQAAPSGCQVK